MRGATSIRISLNQMICKTETFGSIFRDLEVFFEKRGCQERKPFLFQRTLCDIILKLTNQSN